MTVEVWTHTAEGEFKQELPWYAIVGSKGRIVDVESFYRDQGLRIVDPFVITERNVSDMMMYIKRRSRFTVLTAPYVWFTLPDGSRHAATQAQVEEIRD